MTDMKTIAQIGVGILALAVGLLFWFVTARTYMQHDTIAVRSFLLGLVDVLVGSVLLLKAYSANKTWSAKL